MNTQYEANHIAASRADDTPTLIVVLTELVAALAAEVDDAYERADDSAEDLDARLAGLRERLICAEEVLNEYEDGGDLEEPDYHEGIGIEEQLVSAYAHFLRGDTSDCFARNRQNIVEHMRRVIEDGIQGPITATDEQIVAAAKDAYDTEAKRRVRRRR